MINCGWKYLPQDTTPNWWHFRALACNTKALINRKDYPDRRKLLRELNEKTICLCPREDEDGA